MKLVGPAAMVLAAGHGQRMRPLTDTRPKPLIEVRGKPLIDYGLDRLRAAGVSKIVINVHHLSEQIETWAQQRKAMHIEISDERQELLDTGGGVAKALPLLGDAPFLVINSDSFWIDGAEPALNRLLNTWDGTAMDCLLLLCQIDRTVGYDGRGDFVLSDDGRVARRTSSDTGAMVYIGAYLVHPRLFQHAPSGSFSMNVLWDMAIKEGRLSGIAHTGKWIHVGTPDAIAKAERALAE